MQRLWLGVLAVLWVASDVGLANAAWNNVFQPTLFGCRKKRCCPPPAVAQYSPLVVQAAPAAPCQPQCSTSYSQRCYYQPVTAYETRTFYEPVTTYKTSYFYEQVTSYRYTTYYDPSCCAYRQAAVPQVSYELRSKSCPVQSWVQRCAQVPVTAYQKACFWQPQTTCCTTTQGALIPIGASAPAPLLNTPGPAVPPVIDQNRNPTGTSTDVYKPPFMPGASWQPAPGQQTKSPSRTNAPPLPVKLDRIVVGPDALVEGQVLKSDNAPRAGAQVLLVNANNAADRQSVTANSAGRFQVSLGSGGWLVYLQNPDGTASYHSRIDVDDRHPPRVTLVNR